MRLFKVGFGLFSEMLTTAKICVATGKTIARGGAFPLCRSIVAAGAAALSVAVAIIVAGTTMTGETAQAEANESSVAANISSFRVEGYHNQTQSPEGKINITGLVSTGFSGVGYEEITKPQFTLNDNSFSLEIQAEHMLLKGHDEAVFQGSITARLKSIKSKELIVLKGAASSDTLFLHLKEKILRGPSMEVTFDKHSFKGHSLELDYRKKKVRFLGKFEDEHGKPAIKDPLFTWK